MFIIISKPSYENVHVSGNNLEGVIQKILDTGGDIWDNQFKII